MWRQNSESLALCLRYFNFSGLSRASVETSWARLLVLLTPAASTKNVLSFLEHPANPAVAKYCLAGVARFGRQTPDVWDGKCLCEHVLEPQEDDKQRHRCLRIAKVDDEPFGEVSLSWGRRKGNA
jgi:hypothetical protein